MENIFNGLSKSRYNRISTLVAINENDQKATGKFKTLLPGVVFMPISGKSSHLEVLSRLI